MHDIISVVGRRYPAVDIVVIPASVQGESAPSSLVAALDRAARWHGADVLIIGRGGGSREDLWCFNEEPVVRAVAASRIPTVSAVGHEIDVTLCDLAADVRALTPSEAAELVVPSQEAMLALLADFMPDREVVGLDIGGILAYGGGGIHCVTQQVPAI